MHCFIFSVFLFNTFSVRNFYCWNVKKGNLLSFQSDMDPYAKLSELGVVLFQNRRYEECISVLETSRKFQTNQKGITMRILLTHANAHSQLLQSEAAIELYQECLSLATATHEQVYQRICNSVNEVLCICFCLYLLQMILKVHKSFCFLFKEIMSGKISPPYWLCAKKFYVLKNV